MLRSRVIASLIVMCSLWGCTISPTPEAPDESPAAVRVTPASIDIAEVPLVVPIEVVNNIPLIRASVSDLDPGWYVLDTGTTGLVLSPEIASLAEFQWSGEVWFTAFNGRRTMPTAHVDVLTIGGAKFSDFDAIVSDLSRLSISFDRNISGVIGLNVFGSLRLTIDYPNAQFQLAGSPGAHTDQRESVDIVEVPFNRQAYHGIAVPLEVGGEEAQFKLDTGLECGILTNRSIAESYQIDRDAVGSHAMVTFHGNVPSESGKLLEPVWIGRLGISQCEVIVLRETGRHARYVGGDFLKYFSVTIDLEGQRVRLERPNSASPRLVLRQTE